MDGTGCRCGRTNYGQPSFCGNRSAGNVRGRASALGPRWWITSSPIGETGCCLSIPAITRACVSAAMIVKRRWNKPKNDGKTGERTAANLRPHPGACALVRPCVRLRAQGIPQGCRPHPPGSKSFARGAWIPRSLSDVRKFPQTGK